MRGWFRGGVLDFLGRIDFQVKVRGFRIELGEIEAGLLAQEGVSETVVVAQEGASGKQLVAYVSPKTGVTLDVAKLREGLAARVPEYMVPQAFVVLERLPLSPNGKVDRKALPKAELQSAQAYVAPRTETERTLVAVWEEVLGVERVGVHDNFFELGGDSIVLMQVVAKANRAGLGLSTRQVFQHQTVAQLSTVVGTARKLVAEQGSVTGEVPLTAVQRWWLEGKPEEAHHFNQAVMLESVEALDEAALRLALQDLQRQHDGLRSRFERQEGQWRQRVEGAVEEAPLWLEDETVRGLSVVAEAAQRSLSLEKGPLWRVAYVRRAEGVGGVFASRHSPPGGGRGVVAGAAFRLGGGVPGAGFGCGAEAAAEDDVLPGVGGAAV